MTKKNGAGANGANGAATDLKLATRKPAITMATASPTDTAQSQLPPEIREKLAEIRTRVQASVGQVVLAMMNLPRYRSQTLGDLQHLVVEPLLRDRLAIATNVPRDDSGDGAATGNEQVAGIAIWATVSAEVDAKIREQIKGGVFPTRLASDDWASGETLWLLDVIAPTRKVATAVLANFSQIAKGRPVAIHPVVARSVEPELLEKMKVRREGGDAGEAQAAPAGDAGDGAE